MTKCTVLSLYPCIKKQSLENLKTTVLGFRFKFGVFYQPELGALEIFIQINV